MNPFTAIPKRSVASLGEKELLLCIRKWLGPVVPPSPRGMGDDVAFLESWGDNVLTSDSLLYGRHFDESVSPENAGAKLLKRNLSDLAAKGAIPGVAILNGAFPRKLSLEWLERFVVGISATAESYGVEVVGGDLAESQDEIVTSLCLSGKSERFLPRKGGAQGDSIWVTGSLGNTRREHHYAFSPRLKEGQFFASEKAVLACMDISDGLAVDLPQMLAEGISANLFPEKIPCRRKVEGDRENVLRNALTEGEDYELLFFVDQRMEEAHFVQQCSDAGLCRVTCIGKLVTEDKADILLNGKPMERGGGYDHFRSA